MTRGTTTMGLALLMMAGPATRALAQDHDFEWSGPLEAGQELVVRGISGDVVAHLASGVEARVEARKTGRPSDFDRVDVVMSEGRDGIAFCVVYDDRRADSRCDAGYDGDQSRDHDRPGVRAGVDFVVYVPAGVDFSGRTVSGEVEALGLRSNVDAATVSGNVTVSTTGTATGKTVSGDVDVEMGSLDWRRLDFATVSGDITVAVPESLDTRIEFESLSGDFDSDFDLRVTRRSNRFVGQTLEATVGGGARTMTFKTVSGDARLRRIGPAVR